MNESSLSSGQKEAFPVLSGPGLSIVLAALGTSTAAVTLPELSGNFRGHSFDVTLVVSIYILAITVLIVPVGRAGDIFGKRTVLTVGLCLYILGAFLAFEAPTLTFLIASRFVQGAGAAAMMAMPLALVREFVPTEQIGRWMGAMGTMSAIGTASGPAIGGVIVAAFGWRAIFLLQIPVALVGLALCLVFLQNSKPTEKQKGIDLPGALALGVFLAVLTFLISDMANGFGSSVAMLTVVAGGALLAFLVIESNANAPIIPLDLLRSRYLRVSLTMNAVVSLIMMGILVVGPFFLMDGLGLTTAQMGVAMSAGPISSALSGIPAGRLTERMGSGRTVTVGASAIAIATAAMTGLPFFFGLTGFILAFMLLAPSYQVFLTALNTSVMEQASQQDQGVTSGVLNLSRNFGFILGAVAVNTVFSSLSHVDTGIIKDGAQVISLAMAGTFAICCALALGVVLLSIISGRKQ